MPFFIFIFIFFCILILNFEHFSVFFSVCFFIGSLLIFEFLCVFLCVCNLECIHNVFSCSRMIKSDFQSVDCRLCSGRFHIKCADLNKNQDCIDWYCVKCLESIFPFNNIENDQEFMNTIYCYGNLSIKSSMIESLNKIVYNPFACERKRAILNNRDIDPDISYFNTEISNNCTYYLTDEFNDLVNQNWKPSTHLERFSLMHINCRSLLCNFDEVVDFNLSLNNVFDVICMSETWLTDLTVTGPICLFSELQINLILISE